MRTLKLILSQYNEGKITLNEMIEMINEIGRYVGYKNSYGKQVLKAYIQDELVEVSKTSYLSSESTIPQPQVIP